MPLATHIPFEAASYLRKKCSLIDKPHMQSIELSVDVGAILKRYAIRTRKMAQDALRRRLENERA